MSTNQPDTASNPDPNRTTKQHAIVNMQLNNCRLSYVYRKINTRKCCCTVFTTFRCHC